MNRILSPILAALEGLLPILGVTRLGGRRAAAALLATAAHLVPLLGCVFSGWDPVVVLLAYWIDLALVIVFILAALAVFLASRFTGVPGGASLAGYGLPGILERSGGGFGVWAGFLAAWTVFFGALMGANLRVLGALAESHYGLENLSAAFLRLAEGFSPPAGGLAAFLDSEAASLALMVLSSAVTLGLEFFGGDEKRRGKGAYLFLVKPLVRVMAMVLVFGNAMAFGSDRLPALATVSVMAAAMALIDQRIALIDHDFGPRGKGDARFATPHGALMNFGFQVLLIILSASFLVSSLFAMERRNRIMADPVTVQGVIVASRVPDEEDTRTVFGGYWRFVDVEYPAEEDRSRRFLLRDIKVHLPTASDPRGGRMRIIHEAANPRNAFADVPEDRHGPRNMLIRGVILFVLGLAAWWAVGRFFHD